VAKEPDTEAEDWVEDVLNELGIDVGPSAPIHRVRPAAECALPIGFGPRSVFEIGDTLPKFTGRSSGRGPGYRPIPWPTRIVQVADGVVRRIVIRPEETLEWIEREQARRARQRPPRPGKGFRRIGRKLAELIGEEPGASA
jgi:hypothetical protein